MDGNHFVYFGRIFVLPFDQVFFYFEFQIGFVRDALASNYQVPTDFAVNVFRKLLLYIITILSIILFIQRDSLTCNESRPYQRPFRSVHFDCDRQMIVFRFNVLSQFCFRFLLLDHSQVGIFHETKTPCPLTGQDYQLYIITIRFRKRTTVLFSN